MIKSKLKEFLRELKIFKVQTLLAQDCKKRNDQKLSHLCTKLITSDSDIDEAFKSMHQSIMTKIKTYACEDWIVFDIVVKHSTKIFYCYYKENK